MHKKSSVIEYKLTFLAIHFATPDNELATVSHFDNFDFKAACALSTRWVVRVP
jgi:hypothetical protein